MGTESLNGRTDEDSRDIGHMENSRDLAGTMNQRRRISKKDTTAVVKKGKLRCGMGIIDMADLDRENYIGLERMRILKQQNLKL